MSSGSCGIYVSVGGCVGSAGSSEALKSRPRELVGRVVILVMMAKSVTGSIFYLINETDLISTNSWWLVNRIANISILASSFVMLRSV